MGNNPREIIINKLLKEQYLAMNENSWEDLCNRVINTFITHDKKLAEYKELLQKLFYNKLISLNSPALMNLGLSNQCSACFILDVKDSLDSIYTTLKESALLFKSGAGVGLSLSSLREKGADISGGGKSSGIIAWMEQLNTMVESVKQGGKRRGALLVALHISHPEIMDFLEAKTHAYIKQKYNVDDDYTVNLIYDKVRPFSNMNISVVIDNDFIYSYKENLSYNLRSPKDNRIVKQVNARELFNKLIETMYYYGEPGILFDDRMNADNIVPELGKIKSGNPCGEVLLIPYTACALGTLNLYRIMKYLNISFTEEKFSKELKEIIYILVRLVDDIIDINNLPIPKIKENSLKLRPIGIGVMDLAGAMILDGIPYGNNKKCIKYINNIFYNLRKEIIRSSIELAKEKGKVELPNLTAEKVFKGLDINAESNLLKEFQKYGIRNGNLMSIPPTGATGLLYDANSGGIEPLFALKYKRNILGNTYEISPPVLDDAEPHKSVLLTVKDLTPEDHIVVLNEISKYIDMSVSKTINFSANSTLQDIKNSIEKVFYEFTNIKGLTIFKENALLGNAVLENNSGNHQQFGVIKRPRELEGKTSKVKYNDKYVYITVNFYKNRPVEVWLNGGSPGDELNAILWTCGWFISKYLQYGLPLNKMFNKMIHVSSTQNIYGENGVYSGLVNMIFMEIYDIISKKLNTYFLSKKCPKCNSDNYVLESGCWKCYNCGYSKCG